MDFASTASRTRAEDKGSASVHADGHAERFGDFFLVAPALKAASVWKMIQPSQRVVTTTAGR